MSLKHKPIRVIWHDATDVVTDNAWVTKEEAIAAAQEDKAEAISVGFLVSKNTDYIILAHTIMDDCFSGISKVPTKWVKSIKPLR